MWPYIGEDAISVAEFKGLVEQSERKKIVVIVPDGSYRGARKMASKYPGNIPRGGLESVAKTRLICQVFLELTAVDMLSTVVLFEFL